jgi:tRNA pseudouridine38-40 synthase
MRNLKLTLSYEGTNYLGWQKTKMGPSIEETLEKVFEQVLRHPVKLQAASRTDAGVHAQGQVINFLTSSQEELFRLKKKFNGVLPRDLSVLSLEEMLEPFHPTLDAHGKEYTYHICYGAVQLPFHRLTSWHFPYPLDRDEMQKAAQTLVGEHNFSSFSNEKTDDNVREIFSIDVSIIAPQRLQITVRGNRFLYKMVRTLVGTLVYIGSGKLKRSDLAPILASCNRTQAGVTAPAHGLFLTQVFYDQ